MSTLAMIVIAGLLIATILVLIDSGKKTETRQVKEDENNTVSARSKYDITNDYFLLRLNMFLKNNYPFLLSWEFVSTNPFALHYMETGFEVRLFFKNGITCKEHIETKKVWGNVNEPTKTAPEKTAGAPTNNSSNSPQKKTTPVEEFLVKHASSITAEIDKVKEEGAGFFAYYEVDASLADEEFMKKLCTTLSENTGYEVSYEGNTLEIGFQNDL